MAIKIIDVGDEGSFGLIPPCADPRFDHRTCDYWEDADRGSKAIRPALLEASGPPARRAPALDDNPFAPPPKPVVENPFAPTPAIAADDNPFVPTTTRERPLREGV